MKLTREEFFRYAPREVFAADSADAEVNGGLGERALHISAK